MQHATKPAPMKNKSRARQRHHDIITSDYAGGYEGKRKPSTNTKARKNGSPDTTNYIN